MDGLRLSTISSDLLLILWWLYQAHRLQLVLPSLSRSIVFCSLARSRYLYFFSFSFNLFCGHLRRQSSLFGKFFLILFFLLTISRCGRQTEIRRAVWISKSRITLCVSFSRMDSELCIYHLFVWSNLNFLHKSMLITISNQSCLVLHSFCANWLYSLIMWLIFSSLSPDNLHCYFIASYLFFL